MAPQSPNLMAEQQPPQQFFDPNNLNEGQPQQVSGHHFPWRLMLGLFLFVGLIAGAVILVMKFKGGIFGGFMKPVKDLFGVGADAAGVGVDSAGVGVKAAGTLVGVADVVVEGVGEGIGMVGEGIGEGIGTVVEIAKNGKKPNMKPCTAFEKGVKLRDDGTSCWADTIPTGGIGIIPKRRGIYAPGSTEPLFRSCSSGTPAGLDGKGDCYQAADSYGRGIGYVSEKICKDTRNVSSCEKYGGLWYEKCKSGYTNNGCCVCSRPRKVYTKAADRKYCPDTHKHFWGGLCYKNCNKNWHHSGAFCHVDKGKEVECPPDGPNSKHTLLLGALCYIPCQKDYKQVTPELCEPPGGMGIKADLKARQFCPPKDPNLAAYTNMVAGLCYKPGSEPQAPNIGFNREVRSIDVASQSVNMEKEKHNGEQLRKMPVMSRRPRLQRIMPRGVRNMRG